MLLVAAAGIARADAPPAQTLFDPTKDISVGEVKPGMKGYGLSVFSGTRIEKFDVVVVDVVKNFNPKYDAILIRCPQEFLKNTGPIAGMSGSPIYLYDSSGKARLAGAFAYGWPYAKDCLAGVQPIQYMLALPSNNGGGSAGDPAKQSAEPRIAKPRWSLDQTSLHSWTGQSIQSNSPRIGNRPMLGGREIALEPLATPLMAGGVNANTLERIAPLFAGTGLVPMQVGSGNGSEGDSSDPVLEPGSVLAVPLLTGDMELTAVGTCTEKIGDRIFGFGHPFNGEGAIDLPMGAGSVATVVSNLETSFKLGFLSRPSGALLTDQTVGVAGIVGETAPMIPLEVRVVYDDGSVDETYHFHAALHPKLTPVIATTAVSMAMTGEKVLPQYHTVDYDLTAEFADGHSLHLVNSSVGGDGSEVIADVLMPLMAAADNPFKQVSLAKLTGTVRVADTSRAGDIVSVTVPRSKYQPGETVKAYVSYLPFQSEEASLPVELELPRDLPDGQYQFIVSDWTRYLEDEHNANAFKFNADNIDELFGVLRYVCGVQRESVYLRLVRQADGVAVGQIAMPHLPSSQRQVLLESGRSDITPFVTSTVKIIPVGMVMSGAAEFTLTIERHAKVQVPAPAPAVLPPPSS
jgi:hypothetical protein